MGMVYTSALKLMAVTAKVRDSAEKLCTIDPRRKKQISFSVRSAVHVAFILALLFFLTQIIQATNLLSP